MRAISILAAFCASLIGCSTSKVSDIVTPARVEAVVSLGSYVGAKKMIADGKRDVMERCLAGLVTIRDAGNSDLVSVAAALQSAGISFLDTPEGTLALGLVVSFDDLWTSSGKVVLDSSYGAAVRNGAIKGLQLALSQKPVTLTKGLAQGDPVGDQLSDEARKTRR